MIECSVKQFDGRVAFIARQVGFSYVVQSNRHPHAVFHPACVNGNPPWTHVPLNVFEGTIDQFVGRGKQSGGEQRVENAIAAARNLSGTAEIHRVPSLSVIAPRSRDASRSFLPRV